VSEGGQFLLSLDKAEPRPTFLCLKFSAPGPFLPNRVPHQTKSVSSIVRLIRPFQTIPPSSRLVGPEESRWPPTLPRLGPPAGCGEHSRGSGCRSKIVGPISAKSSEISSTSEPA
jgi:hypothetical protein